MVKPSRGYIPPEHGLLGRQSDDACDSVSLSRVSVTYTENAYVNQTSVDRIFVYKVTDHLIVVYGNLAIDNYLPSSESSEIVIGRIEAKPVWPGFITASSQYNLGELLVTFKTNGDIGIMNMSGVNIRGFYRFIIPLVI